MSTRLRSAALLGVLVLVPLLLAPGVFFYFDVTPKVLVLLVGAALVLIPPGRAPVEARLRVVLAALAASLIVSTAFSTDRALSLTGTNWRRYGLVVQLALLLYVYLLSWERVQHVLRAIAASGSLVALYGIAQYFGWDPWLPKQSYHIGEGIWTIVRPPGTLGHAGYFSVYLLHAAAAGAALAWSEEKRLWRWIGCGGAALAVAAVLLSGSRGTMLGLAAGVAALAIRRRPRITARRLVAAGALTAGMAAFYFSPPGMLLRARTRWYREDPRGGGRLQLWADTLRMARPRWLVGYGPETYSSQFPRFESEALARQFPDRYYESPHNIFLDALAGQGALGLLSLAALAALGLWAARTRSAQNDALLAGLVASLVANQFLSFTLPTAMLFFATVTILCAGAAPPPPSPPPRRGRSLLWLPATPALLAAAFSLCWADFWLARTQASLRAGDVERALQHYERLRRWKPPGFDTDLWYSRALAAAAQQTHSEVRSRLAWQQAFAAAWRAASSSEQRPNAYYNLAAFCAMQNNFQTTAQSLRAAIAWAPQWYKPHWMLAQVLRQAGQLLEADAEAERAVELDGGKHTEVTLIRDQIRASLRK